MPPKIALSCPLCGASDAGVVCEFPEFTWVKCGCGLIYKRDESIPEVQYHQEYFANRSSSRRRYDQRTRRRINKSRSQILDVLNHTAPGPLLDVGCSLGYTLRAAADLGLPATGVDISEHAVAVCRDQGFAAEIGTLDELPFDDGSFQLVIMKHVLEHTPRPREALGEIRRVLRAGGGVFIAVPHGGYLKSRLDPAGSRFYRPEVGGAQHYVYYTPATLSHLLRDEGFDPVSRAHPQLVHRRAGIGRKVGEVAVAPLRYAFQRARSLIALDKEFWVTAVRL